MPDNKNWWIEDTKWQNEELRKSTTLSRLEIGTLTHTLMEYEVRFKELESDLEDALNAVKHATTTLNGVTYPACDFVNPRNLKRLRDTT